MNCLEDNPHAGHRLTGRLRGARALEFSMPGGEYRAAYVIIKQEPEEDDEVQEGKQVCLVFMVGPHEGFYEKAERRIVALKRSGLRWQ